MKIGDYETAEFALKEFIDKNKDHVLLVMHNTGMVKHLGYVNYIQMPQQHI